MKALVIGVTGLVGGHVAEQVAADPLWTSVVLLARKPKTRDWKAHCEWRVVDFEAAETYEALKQDGFTHVFSCLGTTMKVAGSPEAFRKVDHDYPLRIAEHTAPAHQLLVSSVGAGSSSAFFYTRTKGQLEDELKKLRLNALDIFQPSFLIGERSQHRPGEKVGIVLSSLAVGPLAKYHGVEAAQVAAAMVRAAKTHTSGTRTHTYRQIVEK